MFHGPSFYYAHFYHGLDEKEIAKAEGVTQQMVLKSLDQAMKNLKGILKM